MKIALNILCAGVACCLAGAAAAADPVAAPVNDGNALVDDQIFAVILQTRQRGTTLMNEAEVRKLTQTIIADGLLDANERDLIDELTVPRIRAINIMPLSDPSKLVVVGALSSAKHLLELPMEPYYAAIYGDGKTAKGWEELVRQSQISDGALERVRGFLANKTAAAAQASTVANVYEPARTLIKDWLAHNKAAAPELQDRGNWLIFQSFEKGDAATDGKLPDFIYNWTKPKPAE